MMYKVATLNSALKITWPCLGVEGVVVIYCVMCVIVKLTKLYASYSLLVTL